MKSLITALDYLLYTNYSNNWDDTLLRNAILAELDDSQTVLNLGAGAGILPQTRFRGHVARLCGIDPDPRVLSNADLDEAKLGVGEAIPYPDNSFDLVFANNVLEHLKQPEVVLHEVARVLKPGGLFVAKTPNRWHYVPAISKLTPHVFHKWLNQLRGRAGEDTFPTYYRANSAGAIRRLAKSNGLVVHQLRLVEGRPEYLRFSVPTYLVGWLYERLVNLIPGLSTFRVVLICTLQKPRSSHNAGQLGQAA